MSTDRTIRLGAFITGGLVVAFALAFFLSPQASSDPDGLNKVAIDQGFDSTETDHALADVPTAGYAVKGVDDERLSKGLSGLIGVTVTFVIAGGLVLAVKKTRAAAPADAGAGSTAS